MTTFPTPQPDQGATNPPDPPSPAWTAVQALATLLEPEAFDPNVKAAPEWRERAKGTALAYAAKVITSGYRLVSEDDTTVERVAEQTRKHALDVGRSNRSQDADYCTCGELIEDWDVHWVRAAVRALREAGQ